MSPKHTYPHPQPPHLTMRHQQLRVRFSEDNAQQQASGEPAESATSNRMNQFLDHEFHAVKQAIDEVNTLATLAVKLLTAKNYIVVRQKEKGTAQWIHIPEHCSVFVEPIQLSSQPRQQAIESLNTYLTNKIKDKAMSVEQQLCSQLSCNTDHEFVRQRIQIKRQELVQRLAQQLATAPVMTKMTYAEQQLMDPDFHKERDGAEAVDLMADVHGDLFSAEPYKQVNSGPKCLRRLRITQKLGGRLQPMEIFDQDALTQAISTVLDGDSDVGAAALQAIVGYAVFTGRTRQELCNSVVQLAGPGATSLANTILQAAGDYGATADALQMVLIKRRTQAFQGEATADSQQCPSDAQRSEKAPA
jgi:hypothetical protein